MTRSVAPEWLVYDVNADIQAKVTAALPELPIQVEARIERLWQAAQTRTGGALFNGLVFSADMITPDGLSGHMTEYRRIVAQIIDPDLHAVLRLRPLAVCGVVRCSDGVVLGRRSLEAGYQPGIWQLPPAGNVDAEAVAADGSLRLRRQMLRELQEELGVGPESVAAMRPLCLIEHPDSHVLDLGFLIEIGLNGAGLRAAHATASDRCEYEPLTVVPYERLESHMTELGDAMMPTAWLFLRRIAALSAKTEADGPDDVRPIGLPTPTWPAATRQPSAQ